MYELANLYDRSLGPNWREIPSALHTTRYFCRPMLAEKRILGSAIINIFCNGNEGETNQKGYFRFSSGRLGTHQVNFTFDSFKNATITSFFAKLSNPDQS